MRLIRHTTPDGKCKYALVRLDKLRAAKISNSQTNAVIETDAALRHLSACGLLEYGEPGTPEECFVIKLKDQFALKALEAYSGEVDKQAHELALAIDTLRKFPNHATSVVNGLCNALQSLHEYSRDLEELKSRARHFEYPRLPT